MRDKKALLVVAVATLIICSGVFLYAVITLWPRTVGRWELTCPAPYAAFQGMEVRFFMGTKSVRVMVDGRNFKAEGSILGTSFDLILKVDGESYWQVAPNTWGELATFTMRDTL